ncbi:MAG: peptide chain release factor N(5)-glutamine methyltransferase [Bacteroidetes bacterium]|nr:peptide chain release factor N(5)-glutamine methyltransferase [Bacteroidota bacterium]
MLNIKQLRQLFVEKLESVYDANEINELFAITAEHVLSMSKKDLQLNSTQSVSDENETRFLQISDRLANSEPIQYILGEADFYGMKFYVNSSVLIPRPETEELVELCKKTVNTKDRTIIDIGTGSGCIAISLAKNTQGRVVAVDISSDALEVAQKNAVKNNQKIEFICADILDRQQWGKLPSMDIIVSNPPYIAESEISKMHSNVLQYEPSIALFVKDSDPLLFYENILLLGKEKLKANGSVFFEINPIYSKELVELASNLGYMNVQIVKDLSGKNRFLKCDIC